MSSSFSVVKPSYLENTNNIIVNGNLTVNGNVSSYVDITLNSLGENTISRFGSFSETAKWFGGVLAPNGKIYGIPYTSTSVLVINTCLPTGYLSLTLINFKSLSAEHALVTLGRMGYKTVIPREHTNK